MHCAQWGEKDFVFTNVKCFLFPINVGYIQSELLCFCVCFYSACLKHSTTSPGVLSIIHEYWHSFGAWQILAHANMYASFGVHMYAGFSVHANMYASFGVHIVSFRFH